MSNKLEDHLYPAGTAADPTVTPSVLDSDGNTVTYTSSKRKTNEATVVDVGDSANSNTGDPLRTAFIKINNFIEASYWANEGVVQTFAQHDSDILMVTHDSLSGDSDLRVSLDSDILTTVHNSASGDSDLRAHIDSEITLINNGIDAGAGFDSDF